MLPVSRSAPRSGRADQDSHSRVDQSVTYGQQFADIYDRLFPQDAESDLAAAYLYGLARTGSDRDPDTVPTFLELGVGTGRIATRVAELGGAVTGIDTSSVLLERARASAVDRGVELNLLERDIRTYRSRKDFDVAYCVCATISMLACPREQAAVLANAAASVRPGGAVVVETHSPERIRRLHDGQTDVTLVTDIGGIPGGLETRSRLAPDEERWTVEHLWHDGDRGRSASEFSRLTGPEQLDALAQEVGLGPVALHSDWSAASYDSGRPLYVRVYRSPDTAAR